MNARKQKQLDFIKSVMEAKHPDHTVAQKRKLNELQTKAEEYSAQVTGEKYDKNTWYYIAKNLQCKTEHEKNKWGRIRFQMPDFNDCDPGNDSYNGLDDYRSVIAARQYLLKKYKQKHKL